MFSPTRNMFFALLALLLLATMALSFLLYQLLAHSRTGDLEAHPGSPTFNQFEPDFWNPPTTCPRSSREGLRARHVCSVPSSPAASSSYLPKRSDTPISTDFDGELSQDGKDGPLLKKRELLDLLDPLMDSITRGLERMIGENGREEPGEGRDLPVYA